jgi:hypothetical protein
MYTLATVLVSLQNPVAIQCKERFVIFPSLAGMSLIKLSLDGNNLIIPAQGKFDQ